MWTTTAAARRVEGITFYDFMVADELPVPRPKEDGLKDSPESTAANYYRMVRQVFRELGYDVENDANPWWHNPPPWDRVFEWRNDPSKGSPARLETQRKALVWYGAYFGQTAGSLPHFMQKTWATARRVERAVNAGVAKKRNRFLSLPRDIQTMLASKPYTDTLKLDRQWGDDEARREAAYLDDLFHAMIGLWPVGFRPQDYATVKLSDYVPERGGIPNLAQSKKYGEERGATASESWVWHADGRVYPSFDWYVQHVRPRVANERSNGHAFLQWNGRPYRPATMRNFIGEGMLRCIGRNSAGPHSLRRACATWRYRHGWEIEEVANLIGDTKDVVEASYIDHAWIRSIHRVKSRKATPEVPMIRSSGVPSLFRRTKAGVWERVALHSPQPESAPAGI